MSSDSFNSSPTPTPEPIQPVSGPPSRPREPDDEPTIISNAPPLEAPSTSPYASPPDTEKRSSGGAFPPGTRLDHFELRDYVGGGGMGHVYRAMDLALDRIVAVKVLSQTRDNSRETIARFINEAKSAAQLNHEHIAQVYYAGEQSGIFYIAFEFVEGVNIREIIQGRGTLPVEVALSYTLQTAQALRHAAERSIVHRDIKPSNLLITKGDRVKLIDMGLARIVADDPDRQDLTATGITLGTFDYISPEQARDPRTADTRSDIYSLGCTFFYMLAGRPPFPEGTVLQKLLQHQGDEPPSIRAFRTDIPDGVVQVLKKMLVKDPRHRFQSADKLVEALLLLAEELGLQPIVLSETMWLASRRSKRAALLAHLPWIAPTAAVLAGVLIMNALWNPGGEPSFDEMSPSYGQRDYDPMAMDLHPPTSEGGSNGEGDNGNGADEGIGEPTENGSSNGADDHSQGTGNGGTDPPDPGVSNQAPPPTSASQLPGVWASIPDSPASLVIETASAGWIGPSDADSTGFLGAPISPEDESLLPFEGLLVYEPSNFSSEDPASPTTMSPTTDPHVRIVSPDSSATGTFNSIAEAILDAPDGMTIELDFSGPINEKPFSIMDRSLTIRAAEGRRPVIQFRPTEDDLTKYASTMATLSNASLRFEGVVIDLEISRSVPADRWAIFEIHPEDRLNFVQCELRIRNLSDEMDAYHKETTFFRLSNSSGDGISAIGSVNSPSSLANLTLEDSFIHGEAVVIHNRDGVLSDCAFLDCLIATTESLLVTESIEVGSDDGFDQDLTFTRSTIFAGGGLIRAEFNEFAPYPFPATVKISGCVVNTSDAPLLQYSDVLYPAYAKMSFQWSGDHNSYENVSRAWLLHPLDGELETESLDLDSWLEGNETDRAARPEWLATRDLLMPLHAWSPEDLELLSTEPAGCDISRLSPAMPDENPLSRTSPTSVNDGTTPSQE
jgi:eukaryotic-like serine/threonine-protein kinase